MYRGMKVAVVVPARDEERLIGRTIWPVPETVDTIYVVDDGSMDRTAETVRHYAKFDYRIRLVRHTTNKGVGAAIITGYRYAYMDGHDIFVVIGGDAQMDWLDLDNLLKPIADGVADYTKGNRFLYGNSKDSPGNAWREMPLKRILGNVSLSIMTKIASGYYHISDSQMGYTSMHRRVFSLVDWNEARKGYGYPAEWLMRFHSVGVRVHDVPVRAIYLHNERQSQIRVRRFLFYMMGIIVKGGLERFNREYVFGRRPLPKITMPLIGIRIGSVIKGVGFRVGSMRILSRLSRLVGFGRIAGSVQSIPKVLSQTFLPEGTISTKKNVLSLKMYGGPSETILIDISFEKLVNRILRGASRTILDSTYHNEPAWNSLEDLRVNVGKVSPGMREPSQMTDLKKSAE